MKIKKMGWFLNSFTFSNIIGITLYPFGIYVKSDKTMKNKEVLNHESIHWEQQKEMTIVGLFISLLFGILIFLLKLSLWWLISLIFIPFLFFYIWYIAEWGLRMFINLGNAYKSLLFEQEAYDNEDNLNYLSNRKKFAMFKYIGKNIWKK